MKPIYDELMEQFYEQGQKKLKKIDDPKESPTLVRGLSTLTMDEQQTRTQVDELKESLYQEELREASCVEAQKHHAEMVGETKTHEEMKLSTIRESLSEFILAEVQVRFQKRQKQEAAKSDSSSNVTRYRNGSYSKKPSYGTRISSERKGPSIKIGGQTKPKEKSAVELNELLMEAKSSRDSSWYDVGTFLNHRVTADGEIKARVRFAGFDNSHDEWVNVNRAIRERSIPLQESECHLVEAGDLVLCFRKGGDSDLYFDAHVMNIERKFHDLQGCRCIFEVCYDHDNYEEAVGLSKLCGRPSRIK